MIVLDSSALVAVLFGEPQAAAIAAKIASDETVMSAANYVECGTVLAGRRRDRPLRAKAHLDRILARAGVAIVPVDAVQAALALEARIRFGKGFGHRAGLNFGDTFAYALAKSLNAPLLFVGDDFGHTDIERALDA